MQLANQEAQRFNHEYIGTEHVLLGLVKEGTGVGANCLVNLTGGNVLRKIRLEVEKRVQSGPEMITMGKLPQTPGCKKVIELAIAQADRLGHSFIGSEHLVLSLSKHQEGVGFAVLTELGVTPEQIEIEIMSLLGSPLEGEPLPPGHQKPIKTPHLKQVCFDLTKLSRIRPALPQDLDLDNFQHASLKLHCSRRNNLFLQGDLCRAQVFVDYLVESFASHADGGPWTFVKPNPLHVRFYAQSMTNKSMFSIFEEAIKSNAHVIVIDDLQAFVDSSLENQYELNHWVHFLRHSSIRMIVNGQKSTYEQLESDLPAFMSCFEQLVLEKFDDDQLAGVVKCRKTELENHHLVTFADEAVNRAIESARENDSYQQQEFALNYLDLAAVVVRQDVEAAGLPDDIKDLDARLRYWNRHREDLIAKGSYPGDDAMGLQPGIDKLTEKRRQLTAFPEVSAFDVERAVKLNRKS